MRLLLRQGKPAQSPATRIVSFQKFEIGDPVIKEVMEAALGVRKTVRKHRETWRKGPAIFNLDHVEGVGQVFELEIEPDVQEERGALRPAEYLELFGPYLGGEIAGSNEDLVAERPWERTSV